MSSSVQPPAVSSHAESTGGAAQEPRRRLVVGTAGHVDHGKTSLVRSLTGVDCDRWEEEKRRGITIDLGFAHRLEATPDGGLVQVGFVDVPGHERFVHNALAGLGGIDLMMLVVAADEGVKPQTREHLAICEMLQIPAGVVALSKCDLVDAELLELAQLELEEELRGTSFEQAQIVAVSSKTGDGLAELMTALVARGRMDRGDSERLGKPTRLPVDRAFQLQGLGVLVTGTLHSGRIATGDAVVVEPSAKAARVRSLQVHGEERAEARAGERVSLQLVGVALEDVARGEVILAEGSPLRCSRKLLLHCELLDSAPQSLEVRRDKPLEIHFHLLSAERLGKLRPLASQSGEEVVIRGGGSGLAEVVLEQPVVAARGDRFVLRRSSPRTTVGGGVVLDPHWRPEARSSRAHARALSLDFESAVVIWAERGGDAGVSAEDVAARLGVELEAAVKVLGGLAREHRLLEVAPRATNTRRWLSPKQVRQVGARAVRALEEFFAQDRLAQGMPKASLISSMLREPAQSLAEVYLEWLEAQKLLAVEGDRVTLPGRAGMTKGESDLASKIVEAFEAFDLTPDSPADICRSLAAKPQLFEGLVKHLVSSGRLVRLPDGLLLSRSAVDRLAERVRALSWEEFTVPQFKEEFGLTRKWAIPLLEALDRQQVTRRSGNVRRVLRPKS